MRLGWGLEHLNDSMCLIATEAIPTFELSCHGFIDVHVL